MGLQYTALCISTISDSNVKKYYDSNLGEHDAEIMALDTVFGLSINPV